MHAPAKIIVSVDGGLGDHVTAEPAIRYLIEKVYPGGDIHVACNVPRVLKHLPVPVHVHGSPDLPLEAAGYKKLFTFPRDGAITQALCFLVAHISNYHAAAMMYRELPLLDRTIRLGINSEDHAELDRVLGGIDPASLVLVHPGKSWRSKTFPSAWWQETVDRLSASGLTVALIGKRSSGNPQDQTGLVEINLPLGGVDLRDKLSLGALFALLSRSPLVLSNDTSIIQMAGAFDIHIVLIASCKHPDFVLPYRHGSPYYKADALYKRLVIDDQPFEPVRDHSLHVDVPVPDWTPYLPEPRDVVSRIEDRLLHLFPRG